MVSSTLDQAQRMGAPRAVALCRNFGGLLSFHAGRWNEAERYLREAVDTYRQLSSSSGESSSLQRLGVLLTACGRLDEAMQALEESVVAAERAVLRAHCLVRSWASMARNRLAAGELEAADRYMAEGRAAADRHGNCVTCDALMLPVSVRVQLAHGRLDAARVDVERLERIAANYDSRAWTAMARQARGRYLAAVGDREGAVEALREAEDAFATYGDVYEAVRCRLARARAVGDAGEADVLAAAAARTLERLGSSFLEGEAAGVW